MLLRAHSRRLARRLHRGLGLGLGLLLVLLGLSGSLLVYYVELDAAVDPVFAGRPAGGSEPSWQAVLDTLERAHPERDRGWRIELSTVGQGWVTARYLKPQETEGAFFAPLLVTVDPTRREVLANRFWGRSAATWLYDLHYTLLGGAAGRTVVGWLGAGLLLLTVLGTALWWPHRGQWRAGLRLKLGGPAARRHYDLHKLLGLGGGLLLLVLAATGVALAWPATAESLARPLGARAPMPVPTLARDPARQPLPLDALLAAVPQAFPGAAVRWVDTPAAGSAVLRVRFWRPGEPSRRFPRSYAWIDVQSGRLLAQQLATDDAPGDRLMAWVHPLHNGEAFGAIGRAVVCAAGLLPLGLALTGWWRWRDRRRARMAALLFKRSSHNSRRTDR